MNADVEKAIEAADAAAAQAVGDSEGIAQWNAIKQALRDQEAEIARLRSLITDVSERSHQCKRCLHPYTPKAGQSEDCPACGFDGITTHLGATHD